MYLSGIFIFFFFELKFSIFFPIFHPIRIRMFSIATSMPDTTTAMGIYFFINFVVNAIVCCCF